MERPKFCGDDKTSSAVHCCSLFRFIRKTGTGWYAIWEYARYVWYIRLCKPDMYGVCTRGAPVFLMLYTFLAQYTNLREYNVLPASPLAPVRNAHAVVFIASYLRACLRESEKSNMDVDMKIKWKIVRLIPLIPGLHTHQPACAHKRVPTFLVPLFEKSSNSAKARCCAQIDFAPRRVDIL
jgi:hypothetical protein